MGDAWLAVGAYEGVSSSLKVFAIQSADDPSKCPPPFPPPPLIPIPASAACACEVSS